MVLQKNFFFSPATRSFKTTLEGNFSFCSDCSENRSDLLGKYLLFGKLNNTLHDTRKKFFLCKTCRMSKLLWNFLWKKKLLHRTQQFSFQNSFTIFCSFFVVFSPTLKKTCLFCFGNLAQNRPWDASWITPQHPSISKTMLFFSSSKTVFLCRKKKNSQILFVQETTTIYKWSWEKMEAYEEEKKPLIITDCNHLFWQKQAVEVADTLFTLWKQTSPGGTTN